jgi:urea carboxylase
VATGERVVAGQKLLVLEELKMEIAVAAPSAGVIEMVNCAPGALVSAGQRLVTLRGEA